MKDNVIYWLWLQECLGQSAQVKSLLADFKTAEAFYKAGKSAWNEQKFVLSIREKLSSKKPDDFVERLNFCREHKIYILCPDDEYYPEALLEIEDYPLALYVRGDYKIFKNNKAMAVIGSRTPCVYGQKAAEKIVSRLVGSGYLIVSGGALGIDSVAHKTAVTYGGKTALIMGCGHGFGYLPENSDLRKLVANNGALISEYPPKHPVTRSSFPDRNRIISALSKGVVIVEAADPSGTFNTANHALEQNKDIFVLPGDIDSGNFAGSNKLITEGAIPVFSGEDILLYCGELDRVTHKNGEKSGKAFIDIDTESEFSKNVVKRTKKKKALKVTKKKDAAEEDTTAAEKCEKKEKICPEGISKNGTIVYNIMSEDIYVVDDISRKSGLDIRNVLVALTELEMLGVIENDGPGKYKFK